MSVRKSSHGTIFLIVSSGSPRALIASSLRSTSKKPFCPMTRSLHPPMTACGHRVRFVATWREEFFEVPSNQSQIQDVLRITVFGAVPPKRCDQRAGRRRGMEDFLAWDVTKGSRLKSAIQLEYADVGRGIAMKKRIVIALLATSFAAGTSFAADWPFAAPPQLSRAGSLPVDWTGLYVGVNAGYGSTTGSSTTAFTGAFAGGTTTQFGIGATELSGTNLVGSSSLRGGIAGGQIGSNWQAAMFVFGGEVDVQWSGQQATASVVCTPGCIANEAVNIKLFA